MINETVTLLKLTGANAYRFSIAWTRLVPNGRYVILYTLNSTDTTTDY